MNTPETVFIEDPDQVVALMKAGANIQMVADCIDVSYEKVRRFLIKNHPDLIPPRGVKKGCISDRLRKVPLASLDDVFKQREAGQTYQQISEGYGVSRERIRQILQARRPELTGCISLMHRPFVCEACYVESTTETKSNFTNARRRKYTPMMCEACLDAFIDYKRVVNTYKTYETRYEYIKRMKKEGHRGYVLGYWFYGKPTEIAYPKRGESPNTYQIWAPRITYLFEKSRQKKQNLETKFPWLKDFFNSLPSHMRISKHARLYAS